MGARDPSSHTPRTTLKADADLHLRGPLESVYKRLEQLPRGHEAPEDFRASQRAGKIKVSIRQTLFGCLAARASSDCRALMHVTITNLAQASNNSRPRRLAQAADIGNPAMPGTSPGSCFEHQRCRDGGWSVLSKVIEASYPETNCML